MPIAARRSSQSCRIAHAAGVQAHHASIVPLAVQHPDRAGLGVQVLGQQRQGFADTQATRYIMTISARFRMPVAARLEHARIRAFTSSGDERFGRQFLPLLAGTWSVAELMVASLEVVSGFASDESAPLFHIVCRSG